jgi:hypothetical protein
VKRCIRRRSPAASVCDSEGAPVEGRHRTAAHPESLSRPWGLESRCRSVAQEMGNSRFFPCGAVVALPSTAWGTGDAPRGHRTPRAQPPRGAAPSVGSRTALPSFQTPRRAAIDP